MCRFMPGGLWIKFFDHLGAYFNKRFGPDWKEKDRFFSDFEKELRAGEESRKETSYRLAFKLNPHPSSLTAP
jgi:hypothetical protein